MMATMQREREEQQKPLLSMDGDGLFDGLSFPEPPTTAPVVGKTIPFTTVTILYLICSMLNYSLIIFIMSIRLN